LDKNDKVKHYIRIKTHNAIVLSFFCKSDIKCLIYIRLMLYNHIESESFNDYNYNPREKKI